MRVLAIPLVGDGVLDVPHLRNPFRYSGEYYDEETGFIYLRARYYDPSIGRFTTEDPIRDGLNWYAYCGNNPVMFVDPWGLAMKIVGTEAERDEFLSYLNEYTRDNIYTEEISHGVWQVYYDPIDGDKYDVGTSLIRDIINNNYTTWLRMNRGSEISGPQPIMRENIGNGVGTGSELYLRTELPAKKGINRKKWN